MNAAIHVVGDFDAQIMDDLALNAEARLHRIIRFVIGADFYDDAARAFRRGRNTCRRKLCGGQLLER